MNVNSTGFVYEVAEGQSGSIALNSTIDYPRFNDQEVIGAEWLYGANASNFIYADANRYLLLIGSFGLEQVISFPVDVGRIPEDTYIYFGKSNIMNESVVIVHQEKAIKRHFHINSSIIINDRDKIYANGGAQVYRGESL